ncbi:MAG: methylated-DNA--[protein]-cysteine S-methyltransferase [Oscillibacter sp.]|nr:methylated-DNA--[protein]-cysteine S-methyltransferase [Oscillibacter sp.]
MESSASFSTFFKKLGGITPSEYAAQRASERPCCFCETPLGLIRIAEDERGISLLKFTDSVPDPMRAGQKGLYLADAEKQILEYFAGKRRTFDIPLSIRGSEFQETVWNALRTIPYGETRSYQQVAQMIGNGKASRAVGMANNRNPILIMIPCHRVVGKDGKLVGYAGGIERKERLLELEREVEK